MSNKNIIALAALQLAMTQLDQSAQAFPPAPAVSARSEKSVELKLPATTSLGQLQYRLGSKNARGRTFNAIGTVKFPAGVAVQLNPSSYLLKHPDQLKLLRGTVSGVVIKGERGKTLLPHLAGDKHIRSLKIEDAVIDKKLLVAINALPELTELSINRNHGPVESTAFDIIHRFKNLETLRVENALAQHAMAALPHTTALRRLEISGISLTKSDFETIARLPTLRYLSLEKCDYPDSAVEKFPQMKSLRVLWLDLRHWSPATIAPLKKMKELEELHVSVYENEWYLLDELHKALPNTQVD